MCDSTLSRVSSSMESSLTTSMASSLTEQTTRTKKRGMQYRNFTHFRMLIDMNFLFRT